MHETIRALLDLDDVNRQRQILVKERQGREARLAEAEEVLQRATQAREQAEEEFGGMEALIRQYSADVERCDSTVERLRDLQMQAKTNKEYLACINGIENAKAEKRLREDSLNELGAKVEERTQHIEELRQAEQQAQEALAALKEQQAGEADRETSEAELDRLYNEKKQAVDPKFLEAYERLIAAKHPMPLMKVDAATRATPMGNMINTQALEQLRLGQLVIDSASNAILYVEE